MLGNEIEVLFVADHLGYAGGIVHGVTTYCRAVFPRLAASGIRFKAIFLGKSQPAGDALRSAGVDVEFLKADRRNVGVGLRLAKRLRQLNPRVLHVTQQKSTVLARMLAPFFGCAVIAHLHDFEPVPRPLKSLAALTPVPERMLCVSSTLIPVATSQYGMPPERCAVLLNGLDLTAFRRTDSDNAGAIRRELDIPRDAPVLGMATRLDADKRPQAFVRDAAAIAASCPGARFIVAGDGTERAACERLAAELGLGARMRFTGFRTDVRGIIDACDVMALYSLVEACPYAAMEALALGKPVIGFAAGGLSEIVRDGVTGLLADPPHADLVVENAVRLMRDSTLRATMSAACRADAERFSLDQHIAALLAHYEEARSDS
jgi:glycosyltransferase involved in cell wall biosynthesis